MLSAKSLLRQMRRQIRLIRSGRNYDEKLVDALIACVEEKYITGISVRYTARGCPSFDIKQPRVTLRGLEFYSSRKNNLKATAALIGTIINFALLIIKDFTPFPKMISDWITSLLT